MYTLVYIFDTISTTVFVVAVFMNENSFMERQLLFLYKEKHKSISYITYGQAAARDISHASVVEFLKRLNGFNIDRIHIEDKFGE